MKINNLLKEVSAGTPDSDRAFKNLERLLGAAPETIELHEQHIDKIAKLFSYSQFLADYAIRNPACLFRSLNVLHADIDKHDILSEACDKYASFRQEERAQVFKLNAMKLLRELKKDYLLIITMQDISAVKDLNECMAALSVLSEALLELALDMSFTLMRRKFGLLRENAFSVIGMGKLGAGELNYSSDVDLVTVYRSEESISTGVLNPFGIRYNKISSHEYFCALTETLINLLQSMTEEGIACRLDLRLRPNGQKGPVSLSLNSYKSYYESWGKTWERLALIRARPVAGDESLGQNFAIMIEPFVWKKSIDFNDIEEIKELKKRIDTLFDVKDIKRSYGGIREIEFFVQTFQLLYGGERKNLRAVKISEALKELALDGFVPADDVRTLSGSYLFLRRLEHVLQMKDDIQTHALPSTPEEIDILAKKMHFRSGADFMSELRLKRLMVRDMYNSLLGGTDAREEPLLANKDELLDEAILDYLRFRGFRSPESAMKNITALHEQVNLGKTLRERTLLRKIIPSFLQQVLKSAHRDRTLGMLVDLVRKIGNHESYVDLLLQREDTRDIIISIFSKSSYLARLLLSVENLEGMFEYPDIRTDYRSLQDRFAAAIRSTPDPFNSIREWKAIEELKMGMLFLKGILDVSSFAHKLSILADSVIRAAVHYLHAEKDFAVVGLGGLGARELNIGSDLDLIFISTQVGPPARETSPSKKRSAEELIRLLTKYTAKGFAYKVDMRLRPEGSRGFLVNDIRRYRNYYLKTARPWEIQLLLRARAVAGDVTLLRAFRQLRREVISRRSREITASNVKAMRRRIVREVSKETLGYDIKNGPGSIKEVEFLIQYLQMEHVSKHPELVVHNTATAIKKLAGYGILDRDSENLLTRAYIFLRTVDTLLRLNEEDVLKTDSELIDIITGFVSLKSKDEFIRKIADTRADVLSMVERFYGGKPS